MHPPKSATGDDEFSHAINSERNVSRSHDSWKVGRGTRDDSTSFWYPYHYRQSADALKAGAHNLWRNFFTFFIGAHASSRTHIVRNENLRVTPALATNTFDLHHARFTKMHFSMIGFIYTSRKSRAWDIATLFSAINIWLFHFFVFTEIFKDILINF